MLGACADQGLGQDGGGERQDGESGSKWEADSKVDG